MKKTFLYILTILVVTFSTSCSQSANIESSNVSVAERDYLSEWADAEVVAEVTSAFCSMSYIGLPAEKIPSYEERKKISDEIAARRHDAYMKTHSFPNTIQWNDLTLSFRNASVSLKSEYAVYNINDNGSYVIFDVLNGLPMHINYDDDYVKTATEGKKDSDKVVKSLDEALELAKNI